jgi:hypothetical protein
VQGFGAAAHDCKGGRHNYEVIIYYTISHGEAQALPQRMARIWQRAAMQGQGIGS